MELLDVVDENNQLTGKTEDKDVIHQMGLWHREVATWIMNEKGEVLIQKRAAFKKQNPNKWGLTAGHIDAGEQPIQGAIREIQEEVGIEVKEQELELILEEKVLEEYPDSKQFNYYFEYWYLLKTDKKIEEYRIETKELSEIKYITLEELKRATMKRDENYTFTRNEGMKEIIPILESKKEKLKP